MTKTEKFLLSLTLVIAFILRFYHLNFQSLWLDELHTMIEADPALSVSALLKYLKCCDPHPPLFFFLERLMFGVFGHSEFVARSLTAGAGTLSVWAIYLLGKELFNVRAGLIAALLTSINYYNIYYSQEARGYILAFLFVCLSYLYFIRMIKSLKTKSAIGYCLFTLCMLLTHYFSLFVFTAQGVTAGIFFLTFTDNKIKFFKTIAASFFVICLAYTVWLPVTLEISGMKSFWITSISQNFAVDYFFEYFGNADLLKPFLLLFMVAYFTWVIIDRGNMKDSQQVFGFIIFSLWIFASYMIPYVRSVFAVPMLFPRYTIVVVPAILLMMSVGISLIQNSSVRVVLLSMFVLTSLVDLFFVKKYYSTVTKTQFREAIELIANDKKNEYIIINPKTTWHLQYYIKKYGMKNKLLGEDTDKMIDSVSKVSNGPGFWLLGAHNTPKISIEKSKQIEANYLLTENRDFHDAWVQLYLPLDAAMRNAKELTFPKPMHFNLNDQDVVALWGGKISADEITLEKGKYRLKIISKGTPALGEFPKINVIVNNIKVGEYISNEGFSQTEFTFEANTEQANITFEMSNDYTDPLTNEDRNCFISRVLIFKTD